MSFRIEKRLGPHNCLRRYVNKLPVKIKNYLQWIFLVQMTVMTAQVTRVALIQTLAMTRKGLCQSWTATSSHHGLRMWRIHSNNRGSYPCSSLQHMQGISRVQVKLWCHGHESHGYGCGFQIPNPRPHRDPLPRCHGFLRCSDVTIKYTKFQNFFPTLN